jgi:tRNA-2-methylthio-N6-dimethylallyladenosine synthase
MAGFTYYFRVFGCQMNVADMDDLRARFARLGGRETERPEDAELVLVNTCRVRAKAEEKAYSFFGELKQLGERPSPPFLAAMGCAVNRNHTEIERRAPHLDLLMDYSDPDSVLAELARHFPPLADADPAADYPPLMGGTDARQRFVTAIRGCQHGCSFCVVPRARGPQRDVPLARILAEARALEAAGAPDITILGQNVLAYGTTSGAGHNRFIELLETLLAETSFRWITFLTSLPGDLTPEICERVIAQPRITPLLHLPVQSGSDKVLRNMRRGHTVADYKERVAYARQCRPDLYLTTDLLVGFPTETDEDFQATLRLAREVGFDDAFMFAYSERPHTIAARTLADSIPREEKLRRLNLLIERQREWGAHRNQRYVGQELDVIIEHAGDGETIARTAFNKPVRLAATSHQVGEFARVRVTGVKTSSFSGEEAG